MHASEGIVRFAGYVFAGTSDDLFTIPASDAPSTVVYVPTTADCGGSQFDVGARLIITPDGQVQAQGNGTDVAGCHISLEGVWFAR